MALHVKPPPVVGKSVNDQGQRLDAQGYIIKEDLPYGFDDVSNALGASGRLYELSEVAQTFLDKLKADPESVTFEATMSMIESEFEYLPTRFAIGDVESEPGVNEGSCKIMSFARLSGLDVEDAKMTLNLFGDYYRKETLGDPSGDSHANIRALMAGGWDAVKFPNGLCLTPKEGTFGIDADVGVMLDAASTISGDEGWDPDSDIWIP